MEVSIVIAVFTFTVLAITVLVVAISLLGSRCRVSRLFLLRVNHQAPQGADRNDCRVRKPLDDLLLALGMSYDTDGYGEARPSRDAAVRSTKVARRYMQPRRVAWKGVEPRTIM